MKQVVFLAFYFLTVRACLNGNASRGYINIRCATSGGTSLGDDSSLCNSCLGLAGTESSPCVGSQASNVCGNHAITPVLNKFNTLREDIFQQCKNLTQSTANICGCGATWTAAYGCMRDKINEKLNEKFVDKWVEYMGYSKNTFVNRVKPLMRMGSLPFVETVVNEVFFNNVYEFASSSLRPYYNNNQGPPPPSSNSGTSTSGPHGCSPACQQGYVCDNGVCKKGCFPSNATVELKDGSFLPMVALRPGDVVKVGANKYDKIYFFSHFQPTEMMEVITLNSFSTSLSLSLHHYLYINGELRPASEAVVGDWIRLETRQEQILKISKGIAVGMINPWTLGGELLVDGVQTSCYTTGAVLSPNYAHYLTYPIQLFYHLVQPFFSSPSLPFSRLAASLFDGSFVDNYLREMHILS